MLCFSRSDLNLHALLVPQPDTSSPSLLDNRRQKLYPAGASLAAGPPSARRLPGSLSGESSVAGPGAAWGMMGLPFPSLPSFLLPFWLCWMVRREKLYLDSCMQGFTWSGEVVSAVVIAQLLPSRAPSSDAAAFGSDGASVCAQERTGDCQVRLAMRIPSAPLRPLE